MRCEARTVLASSNSLTKAVVLTVLTVIFDGVVASLDGRGVTSVASVIALDGLDGTDCSNSCSDSLHILNLFLKLKPTT